ncbi:hypothetical protein ABI59_11225 [Acidobacteria bacterium Mor1]|nr:hypothetical protein ABI59_11225 [Acidobacteria bacterium Mor1]
MRWVPLAIVLLLLSTAPISAQDADGDGVLDAVDNCVDRFNPLQLNSDYDRFGNVCDGDLDQDGVADGTDRSLVIGESGSSSPRPVADLNEDGVVDQTDVDWFIDELEGNPLGPAGPMAHDADGDGLLDFCRAGDYESCMNGCAGDFDTCYGTCGNGRPPFRERWDETTQPNLIQNGELAGTPPTGWGTLNQRYIDASPDVRRVGDSAFQWLAWGGAGHGGGDLCGSSCVQPQPVPVAHGSAYVYSFFVCMPEYPPTSMSLSFSEYDGSGTFLGNVGGSKLMPSQEGVWEETAYVYRPSSAEVALVRPKLFRKAGPGWARMTLWADDFAFWQLPPDGSPTYRMPPAAKHSFNGARTRVDDLGNFEIFRDGEWRPFFPFTIYVHHPQDFQVYSDAGFNVAMNERGFGVEAGKAIDAVSPFNPDGMEYLFISHTWSDPGPTDLQLDVALDNLRTKTSPARGVRLWERLFAFNYDNEIFSDCGLEDDVTEECLQRMWQAQIAPMTDIFQADRDENGGVRGVPSYMLNGNEGVARAYDKPESAVNAQGDLRMDITGTYGAESLGHMGHIDNQTAPPLNVQIQTSVGDRYRALAYGGVGLGAKMIGTWRDWAPTTGSHGNIYKSPVLRLCGATDFGLQARLNYYNPPGQIIEGLLSGARAEVLANPTAYNSCSGDGASYRIHMQSGEFQIGEGLRDVSSGDPIAGASVAEVSGAFLVDYQITIEQRNWYQEIPKLRREFEALGPVLRATHWTDWGATCNATAIDEPGQPGVPFGDDGILCGRRELDGKGYLILANNYHRVDPYAPWDQQIVGSRLQVEVQLDGLAYAPDRAVPFDPENLTFTEVGAAPIAAGSFTVQLPALGVLVVRLEDAAPAPSGVSDAAAGMNPMTVSDRLDADTVVLSYDPACGAGDHGVLSGPLGSVGSYAYDRMGCGLGTSGSATVDVGAGDRFWLLVGRTAEFEGGAGAATSGLDRPGSDPAFGCHLPRTLGEACP